MPPPHPTPTSNERVLRVGSLFSGYCGLELAVEHTFGARTTWFCEIAHPARVFTHHWPDAPNLGDISTIDWHEVEPSQRGARLVVSGRRATRPLARCSCGILSTWSTYLECRDLRWTG